MQSFAQFYGEVACQLRQLNNGFVICVIKDLSQVKPLAVTFSNGVSQYTSFLKNPIVPVPNNNEEYAYVFAGIVADEESDDARWRVGHSMLGANGLRFTYTKIGTSWRKSGSIILHD